MTSPAIKLARELHIYGGKVQNLEGEDGYWVEDVSEKTMERFYTKAQAQILREYAMKPNANRTRAALLSRADDLERGA